MKSVTFYKPPATLAELNRRLEECLSQKSRKPLGLDVPDDELPQVDFSLVGPVLAQCLESFDQLPLEGTRLLQNRLLSLFPLTKQSQAAYRVLSAVLNKPQAPPQQISSISIEEALGHFLKSAAEKPEARFQKMWQMEPQPKSPYERAEKFQAALSWMLFEGRVLRMAELSYQAAMQIADRQKQADAPIVYPQEVSGAEELAFWLQLPGLLTRIRGPQTEPCELFGIYQKLRKHGRYRNGAMAVLEFQLSLSQLYSREKTMATFLDSILPGSLLQATLGKWSIVQQAAAPFGTCFLKLRKSQKEKTKPGQMVLDHYFEYRKIFEAFMKARDDQCRLFEFALGQFTLFIRRQKKPREWMSYKQDAGPQGDTEEIPFGSHYRIFDPGRLPTPIEYLCAAQTEEKAAPELVKGKDFPFSYALESEKGISRTADRYFDCGLKFEWEECTLYVVPAQMAKQPGTLAYAVKDGVCFQRVFHARTLSFLFEKFSAKSFTLRDFPELEALVQAMPALSSAALPQEADILPHGESIKISPSLTLFPLYVDN